MSTIRAILEANSDGTVHVPLPPELRGGMLKITAAVEAVVNENVIPMIHGLKGFGSLKGQIWIADDFDAPLDDFKEYME